MKVRLSGEEKEQEVRSSQIQPTTHSPIYMSITEPQTSLAYLEEEEMAMAGLKLLSENEGERGR